MSGGFALALGSLLAHKLRSLLTMLGIVIGIAAVITVVAVGRGAERQVADQLRSLGANLLLISPGAKQREGVRLATGTVLTLTEDDAAAIRSGIPAVVTAGVFVSGRAQIVAANKNWSTLAAGVSPDYLAARDWTVERGAPFDPSDIERAAKTVLLGRTVARQLFASADPVGRLVRIGSASFVVIGVLAAKGQNAAGRDQDDVVLMPVSTARIRLLGRSKVVPHRVGGILVKVHDAAAMAAAMADIRALLRHRHRLDGDKRDDFQIQNLVDVSRAREASVRQFTIMVGIIASVSLIVGGVGVMNTMLVSVTERTREIGVRLAIGATPGHIRAQFLAEAAVLTLIAGLVGLAAGYGAAHLITKLLAWPAVVEPGAAAIALAVSAAVGMVFGFYPAHRAARLDPAEALRAE